MTDSRHTGAVALIPARGGSKRLPGKNLRLLDGKPLIVHSILTAMAIDRFDRCVVSTEDSAIARVALEWGAEVVERPVELAGDRATTASAVNHFLDVTAKRRLPAPEVVVLLQPTCPLRPTWMVQQALDLLDEDVDSVVSVTPFHGKAGVLREGLFVPEYVPGTRSQDMPARYVENGLVYAFWSRTVRESGTVFGNRVRALVADALYASGDIDTELDFHVTEFLYRKYRHHFEWTSDRRVAAPVGVRADT
jgi:N-acylneuraminate cytidylyltransferase